MQRLLLLLILIPTAALAQIQSAQTDLSTALTAEQVRSDLDAIVAWAERDWSLSDYGELELDDEIAGVRKLSAAGMTRAQFALELQRLLARSADGHAAASSFVGLWNGMADVGGEDRRTGQLPFQIDLVGDRYVAYVIDRAPTEFVNPDRRYRYALLNDGHPYVTAIDGMPIERWVAAAEPFVAKGPALGKRWRCVQILNGLRFMRGQLGLPLNETVSVTLTGEAAADTKTLDLPTADLYQFHLPKPQPDWAVLPSGVGYIWLRNCAEPGTKTVLEAMPKLQETKGLVIDCRDNLGHGPPTLGMILGMYFMGDADRRQVVGALATPDHVDPGEGVVYPGMDGLDEAEEVALQTFKANFESDHTFAADRYRMDFVMLTNPRRFDAQWGIFSIPQARAMLEEAVYHYDRPVVILTSHRTYSAGEILVAMLQALPNVTIVGTPTAGGGASPTELQLPESRLSVIGGQRVFVLPDGQLIDGHGVQPDVVVHPDADYYRGTHDATLDKAIELIEASE